MEGYKSGNFYYNGYIKGVGATGNVSQGNTVGTIGKKQQLQSLTLYLDQSNKLAPSGTIQYATHIAKEGWKDWSDAGTTNGASTGTNGMEAVKIRLTGNLAKYYDIYYRAHVQGYGWLGWAKNGQAKQEHQKSDTEWKDYRFALYQKMQQQLRGKMLIIIQKRKRLRQ